MADLARRLAAVLDGLRAPHDGRVLAEAHPLATDLSEAHAQVNALADGLVSRLRAHRQLLAREQDAGARRKYANVLKECATLDGELHAITSELDAQIGALRPCARQPFDGAAGGTLHAFLAGVAKENGLDLVKHHDDATHKDVLTVCGALIVVDVEVAADQLQRVTGVKLSSGAGESTDCPALRRMLLRGDRAAFEDEVRRLARADKFSAAHGVDARALVRAVAKQLKSAKILDGHSVLVSHPTRLVPCLWFFSPGLRIIADEDQAPAAEFQQRAFIAPLYDDAGGKAGLQIELDRPVLCTLANARALVGKSGGEDEDIESSGDPRAFLDALRGIAAGDEDEGHVDSTAEVLIAGSRHVYTLTADPPAVDVFVVRRVPFGNAADLQRILRVLRRQLVFNTLVQSITSGGRGSSGGPAVTQLVLVAAHVSPAASTIALTLRHVAMRAVVDVRLSVRDGAIVECGAAAVDGVPDKELSSAVERAATEAMDIPVVVEKCVQLLEKR